MEKKKTENNEYMNQRRAEYGDANKYGFRAARSIAKNGEKAAAKKKELAKKVSGSKQKTPRDMEISEAIKRGKEMGKKTRSNHLNGIY